MRLLPLLLFLFITNTLFSQKISKGLYMLDNHELGGFVFEFDGKGNFEMKKPSLHSPKKGCGTYTLNDSLLTLEYSLHPDDTPLFKSTVKYAGQSTNDSIDVQLTLVDTDFPDSVQRIYSVYIKLDGEEKMAEITKVTKQAVNFRLAVSDIPCKLVADNFYFLYGEAEITQARNTQLSISAKRNSTGKYKCIPIGTVEKYSISHLTPSGFYLGVGGLYRPYIKIR